MTLEAHPYADRFPLLCDAELVELVESIKANGLRNPIVLDTDGRILDGRNRARACEIAGVEPEYVTYEGDDLAEYVIDTNASRRHMTTGARAMATALVLADDGRRVNGRWKRGSVATGNGGSANSVDWSHRLKECGVVLDHRPDLAEDVANGAVALDAAYRQATAIREAVDAQREHEAELAAEEVQARTFVEAQAPDLAAQVGDTFLTYSEALAIWQQRNREEAARLAAERAEAERKARAHDEAMRDLYTPIAKAIQTIAGYGGYADIGALWSSYEPRHLMPPQLEASFDIDQLEDAHRLIDWLKAWTKENR